MKKIFSFFIFSLLLASCGSSNNLQNLNCPNGTIATTNTNGQAICSANGNGTYNNYPNGTGNYPSGTGNYPYYPTGGYGPGFGGSFPPVYNGGFYPPLPYPPPYGGPFNF